MRPYAEIKATRGLERIKTGQCASTDKDERNGAFTLWLTPRRRAFMIVSDSTHLTDAEHPEISKLDPWEHVSVHIKYRNLNQKVSMMTPDWDEMCRVKDVWFGLGEMVIQFHPPQTEYVNTHQHVLHLWKPVNQEIPHPPKIYV